mgnify:CR=1 FL=1
MAEPNFNNVRIEVAVAPGAPNKDKGDLLEVLSKEFVELMQFDVTQSVRVTASELDLHCQHRRNPRRVLVECKAHKGNLPADVFHKLYGKVGFHGFDEGWLISTGPLGRDAEGYRIEWEQKPEKERKILTIYTPNRLVDALVKAKMIVSPPETLVRQGFPDRDVGEWVLLITPFGRYWCVQLVLQGLPSSVALIHAVDGSPVRDSNEIDRFESLHTTFAQHQLTITGWSGRSGDSTNAPPTPTNIIHVQQGDSWRDYRPSRPQDFVGRGDETRQIFSLLKEVQSDATPTRVFAITGNSGVGKSSLIASIRGRAQNTRNRGWLTFIAVDVRAARDPSYMMGALQEAIESATLATGINAGQTVIQSASNPIHGPTLERLEEISLNQRVVCLVFDQFEEIYTRPDLFPLFEALHSLCLSTVGARTSLVLGFAWKSDATVHQDHPAYYLWQQIADHRMEIHLGRLDSASCSLAVTNMEKELGKKVSKRLRRHIIQQSDDCPGGFANSSSIFTTNSKVE